MLITGTSLTHLFVTIEFSLLYRQANHWDLSISIGTLPFYIKQPRRIDRRHRVARSQERDSFWRERLVGLCFITKQLLEECRALAETFSRCVLLKSLTSTKMKSKYYLSCYHSNVCSKQLVTDWRSLQKEQQIW